MKEYNYSYKLSYKRYLKQICRFLDDMDTKLTHKRIPYENITNVYGKTLVIVVCVILKLEIIKSSYIENIMF